MIDIKNKDIKVVDLDGAYIDGFKPERAMYLTPLIKFHGLEEKYPTDTSVDGKTVIAPSENADLYCYCTMILNLIAKEKTSFYRQSDLANYLDYLQSLGYPLEILDIFNCLYTLKDNQNPKELLDLLPNHEQSSHKSYLRARTL